MMKPLSRLRRFLRRQAGHLDEEESEAIADAFCMLDAADPVYNQSTLSESELLGQFRLGKEILHGSNISSFDEQQQTVIREGRFFEPYRESLHHLFRALG